MLTLAGVIAWLAVSPILAQSSSAAVSETAPTSRVTKPGAVHRQAIEVPTSAETESTPGWRFDAGFSISPLFAAYLDVPSCCTPLGGWVTVGSGRFRLQGDYLRNVRRRLSYAGYFEEHLGQEILVDRAYLDSHVEQRVGVSAYWRLSKNQRLTPHLLFGVDLWHLADRPCVAEGNPVGGIPEPGQQFRVDFADERQCQDEPFLTRYRIGPGFGAGLDFSIGSRMFGRLQYRNFRELRIGAGVRF